MADAMGDGPLNAENLPKPEHQYDIFFVGSDRPQRFLGVLGFDEDWDGPLGYWLKCTHRYSSHDGKPIVQTARIAIKHVTSIVDMGEL